eukprot:jgi/Astpho2/3658/Aster-07860
MYCGRSNGHLGGWAQHKADEIVEYATGNGQCRLTFDTKDAQASLRFGEVFEDGVTKIVVADVAPNSPAEEAGIKIGQQVTAVSDPNFPNQLLDTSRQASKIGVTRSLSLRISPTIDMAFGDVPKTLKSVGSEEAIRDKLLKENRENTSKVNISEERKADRAQLISEQGTRSGKNVLGFAGVSAIFLFGLPLVILAIAIGSGYLQQLGGNYGF